MYRNTNEPHQNLALPYKKAPLFTHTNNIKLYNLTPFTNSLIHSLTLQAILAITTNDI